MAGLIFVVEDDPIITDVIKDILTTAGYDVTTIDSAFGVAGLVRDLQPAAILLDLGLPFRTGADLLDELKADPRTAQVPVIVVSGLTEILSEERRALTAAVLAKPFQIERLLETLDRASAPSGHDTGAA